MWAWGSTRARLVVLLTDGSVTVIICKSRLKVARDGQPRVQPASEGSPGRLVIVVAREDGHLFGSAAFLRPAHHAEAVS
jgi:hypothetical protein